MQQEQNRGTPAPVRSNGTDRAPPRNEPSFATRKLLENWRDKYYHA